MGNRFPLLLVGGGIGGLAAALAIARTGRPVHVVEQAQEFTELGAGLQLAANATRVLDELDVLGDAEDVAVRPERAVMMHAVTGEPLTALCLGETYRKHYGHPYLVLHRGDLLTILLERCRAHGEVTLENGRTVVAVTHRQDGAEVRFADGTSYECDVLVGADGLRSTVRRLLSDDEAVHTGYVTYRGAVPVELVPGGEVSPDVVVWIGPGMHLVHYPIRQGGLYNQAAVFRSDGYFAGRDEWGTPEELDERFSRACPQVRTALSLLRRDRRWAVCDRKPLPAWVEGRVALLGDAAHPMVQYLAQGACQALEDARALAFALDAQPSSVDRALAAYERIRLPRATRCQTAARNWGELWHTNDPITIGLRDRLFRMRAADDYTEVDWLYA